MPLLRDWRLTGLLAKGRWTCPETTEGLTQDTLETIRNCEEVYLFESEEIPDLIVAAFPSLQGISATCCFSLAFNQLGEMPDISEEDKNAIGLSVWHGDIKPWKTVVTRLESEIKRLGINTKLDADTFPAIEFEFCEKCQAIDKAMVYFGRDAHTLDGGSLSFDEALSTIAGFYELPDNAGYAAALDTLCFTKSGANND